MDPPEFGPDIPPYKQVSHAAHTIEDAPKSESTEFEKIIKLFADEIPDIAQAMGEIAMETVVQKLFAHWNIKEVDLIHTSLEVLFMSLKDIEDIKISELFNKILAKSSTKVQGTQISKENLKVATDVHDLYSIIQSAAYSKKQIKAVGKKYSGFWTGIGDSDGVIIDTSSLKRELKIEFLKGTYEKPETLRRFEAGITMDDLQNKLWPSSERSRKGEHRVLKQVTNGADLSLAGTVTTGAHGNGLNIGIVADAVVSFQIFTVDSKWEVKRYQIEKSDGITNREEFEDQNKDNFELIQNDEVFKASVVNIGCMGVVYSYVLDTDPAFYLEEERKIYKWSDAKQEIRKLYNDTSVYNFQVIGSPYAYRLSRNETDEHRVLISILKKTEVHQGKCERSKGHLNLPMGLLDKAIVAIGNSSPHMIPVLMHLPLKFLEHEKVVLNAVEAFNTLSGVVSKEFSGVRSSECAMKSDGPETAIEIIEDLHKLYSDIRRSNDRQIVNVPIALRFTAPSDKYMAMGYDCHRPTITIEQSIINGTLGADDTLRKFRKRMFEKFQGRPHWGLLHELDADKVEILYGSTGRKNFTSALNDFDPNFVFENDFAAWVFGKERRNNKESIIPPKIQGIQIHRYDGLKSEGEQATWSEGEI